MSYVFSELGPLPSLLSVPSEDQSPVLRLILMLGSNFSVSCALDRHFPVTQLHLLAPSGNYTLPAVNHSAHFLFVTFSPAHFGKYTCVYCDTVDSQDHCFRSSTLYISPEGGAPTVLALVLCVALVITAAVTFYCRRRSPTGRGLGPDPEGQYENFTLESRPENNDQGQRVEQTEPIYEEVNQDNTRAPAQGEYVNVRTDSSPENIYQGLCLEEVESPYTPLPVRSAGGARGDTEPPPDDHTD